MLCAACFAQQGARVGVYERRSAEQQTSPELGWSIALGGVAREALGSAGLCSDFGPSGRYGRFDTAPCARVLSSLHIYRTHECSKVMRDVSYLLLLDCGASGALSWHVYGLFAYL